MSWEIEKYSVGLDEHLEIWDNDSDKMSQLVCKFKGAITRGHKIEIETNAQLIVSAPEMYEALLNIEANLTGKDHIQERIADSLRRAREAIARAEGK
jgi:hypothetical protein